MYTEIQRNLSQSEDIMKYMRLKMYTLISPIVMTTSSTSHRLHVVKYTGDKYSKISINMNKYLD